jgi:hypothetical protein
MSATDQILHNLQVLRNPAIAAQSLRFFKTGKGEYGEAGQGVWQRLVR